MTGGPNLLVEVEDASRGGVARPPAPSFATRVLLAASAIPEVAVRMPEGQAEVAVRITDDEDLRRLNREFLGEDHPTDVLSFPAGGGPAGDAAYLGDVAISWDAVLRQAAQFGHGPDAELALLLVHALLHLLGWDHAGRVEEAEMSRLTLAALASAGVSLAPGRI